MPPWQHLRLRDRQEREGLARVLLLERDGQLPEGSRTCPEGSYLGRGVSRKQTQRCPAANALAPLLGTLQEPAQPLVRSPAKPQGAALTLARAAHGVIATKGLRPAGQACRATPVLHLAVAAAQLPAEQGLDVLDCGRRRRNGVRLWVSECGSAWGLRPEKPAGRSLVTVFYPPDMGLQSPPPPACACPNSGYNNQDTPGPCLREMLDQGAGGGAAGDTLGLVRNVGVCLAVDCHTDGQRPWESSLWGQVRSH